MIGRRHSSVGRTPAYMAKDWRFESLPCQQTWARRIQTVNWWLWQFDHAYVSCELSVIEVLQIPEPTRVWLHVSSRICLRKLHSQTLSWTSWLPVSMWEYIITKLDLITNSYWWHHLLSYKPLLWAQEALNNHDDRAMQKYLQPILFLGDILDFINVFH
jgi:hypothetical protein